MWWECKYWYEFQIRPGIPDISRLRSGGKQNSSIFRLKCRPSNSYLTYMVICLSSHLGPFTVQKCHFKGLSFTQLLFPHCLTVRRETWRGSTTTSGRFVGNSSRYDYNGFCNLRKSHMSNPTAKAVLPWAWIYHCISMPIYLFLFRTWTFILKKCRQLS